MKITKGKFSSMLIRPGNGYIYELTVGDVKIMCSENKLAKVQELFGKEVVVCYEIPSEEIYGISFNTLVSMKEE